MPKNTLYAFVNAQKKNRYSSLKIQESNTVKNHGRKAIYVTLSSNTRQPIILFPQKSPGFIVSNIHLSIDEHYLADSAHKPPEHTTLVLENINTQEKIVLHCNYKLHADDALIVTGKRMACKDGLEHDLELLKFNEHETLQIKTIIQEHTQLRRRFINDHSIVVNTLEQEITSCHTNIAIAISDMESAQRNNNKALPFQQRAIKETKTLLQHLETYNLYNNQAKYAHYKHGLKMLEQLTETVSLFKTPLPPVVETSIPVLTSSMQRTQISTQTQSQSQKVLFLTELKKEIEETVHQIRVIQASSINPVDQLARTKPLQESLKINLTILFCDHTTKYTVDLRNFIAETEAYLGTIKTIENLFSDCLKTGDVEGVKLIYPHIREKIEADTEGNIFTNIISQLGNNDFAFTQKLTDIGDYFFYQNSQGFRDVIEAQGLIYYHDNGTGYSHSVLHELFLQNRVAAFAFLLKYSLSYELNLPALFNQQIQFNIAQSIIARFMSNPNIAFFRILHQLGQFDTPASENRLTPIDLEAITSASTILPPSNHATTSKAMMNMDYFELAIYFTLNQNGYDPTELIQFWRDKFDLNRILTGLANLLNRTCIRMRMLPAKTSQVLFVDDQAKCEIASQNANASLGMNLFLIFYGTQQASPVIKKTLKSVLAIVAEKFLLLSSAQQRELTLHYKEMTSEYFKNKNHPLATQSILLAQVLNSLMPNPCGQDHYIKLQILCWRAKISKDTHNMFAVANMVLNHIPTDQLQILNEDNKFKALCNSIRQKAPEMYSNATILFSSNTSPGGGDKKTHGPSTP